MKKILLVLAVLVSAFAVSAKDKTPGQPLVCDTVLQAPGLTADQIYGKAKNWLANNMPNATNIIQLDDDVNKHLTSKATLGFEVNHLTLSSLTGYIRFNIDIAARDGRYRVRFSDFNHEAVRDGWSEGPVYVNGPNPNVKGLRKIQNAEMQKRAVALCTESIDSFLKSLQEAMSGASSATQGDW